jgi:predicted Rossmann fold flavoprotein
MLWTHFGVSGPVVLNASRHWHAARLEDRPVSLSVSFLPGDSFDSAERRLIELATGQPRVAVHNALAALVPARVADSVVAQLAIDVRIPMGQLARDARRKLVEALIDWPLPVRDSRGYQYAEVTAGGVPLDEIDPRTMESRKCPGLYLVGEILDVDGRIGGFNFQWAWSSAWVAAKGLVELLNC